MFYEQSVSLRLYLILVKLVGLCNFHITYVNNILEQIKFLILLKLLLYT